LHAVLQHTPSTQLPLEHSAFRLHATPFARSEHVAAPLHSVAPGHSASGSVAAAMLPHVPFAPEFFFTALHA
jgi:hypothetical protein